MHLYKLGLLHYMSSSPLVDLEFSLKIILKVFISSGKLPLSIQAATGSLLLLLDLLLILLLEYLHFIL